MAQTKTTLILWASLLFWASAFAGIRAGLQHYSPSHLADLRFLVASGTLALGTLIKGVRRPAWRDLPRLFLLGLGGIAIYHTALNYGEMTVNAGAASFMINVAPLLSTLMSVVFLGEHFRFSGWLGLLVSFTGVSLIAFGEGGGMSFDRGNLYVLTSAMCGAVYSVLQKPLLTKYSAFEVACYSIWLGTLCLLVPAWDLIEGIQRAPLPTTLAVIYLGVFPAAISYFGWSYVLARMPVSSASSFLYLIPVLSTLIGFIWLGEVPRRLTLLGGSLALGGVLGVSLFGAIQSNRAIARKDAVPQ
jgi:drug/metabolite transporter (DMT)-like permease